MWQAYLPSLALLNIRSQLSSVPHASSCSPHLADSFSYAIIWFAYLRILSRNVTKSCECPKWYAFSVLSYIMHGFNGTHPLDVAWSKRMGAYCVTSPNVSDIPFMPTGDVALCMHEDGRYGQHDFMIFPQVYSVDHPHRILIRDRRSSRNRDIACVWWNPSPSDFQTLPNSVYSDLGRCSSPFFLQLDELGHLLKQRMAALSALTHGVSSIMLHKLAATMRHAMLLIRFNTYTLRELVVGVAYAQRTYLDALALADYVEFGFYARLHTLPVMVQRPASHVLGASSVDASTVNRLQAAGVPAYLIVPHSEALVLGATTVIETQPNPPSIADDHCEGGCIPIKPPVYTGIASSEMHRIMTLPPIYASLEHYFLGLDRHFNTVPLGVRGTVITSSLPASQCKATSKCTSISTSFNLPLIIISSSKDNYNFAGSTRQMD